MNFKEKYKMEINEIRHDKILDEQILKEIVRQEHPLRKRQYRFVPAIVAAAIALVIMVCNFETMAVYATTLFGNFGLTLGGTKVVLDEIEPVDLDYERYTNDERAEWKGANFYYSYEDFHEGLGMQLPGSNTFEYKEIMVHLVEGNKAGHIGVDFVHEDERYYMNGRFVVSDFENEMLGYGTTNKAYEVYEYADGKKAYFVKEGDVENQTVYFATEKYIFQLFVENSKEGIKRAKEILNVIGNEP